MLTYDLDGRNGLPKYEYLYLQIKKDILDGRLKAGEKLPSKRALAEHLGVSVVTVETAYMQLQAEGYISSRSRSGFYVDSINIPTVAPRRAVAQIQVPMGEAAAEDFGLSVLPKIMRRVIADYGDKLLAKPPHNGCYELRRAIAEHLRSYRGMQVSTDNIVIGSGAEYLYGLIAQLFGSGTIYGVEDPSYEKIRMVYRAHGAQCRLLDMDGSGISAEALRTTDARVLHVSPFHSYPTGISAPASKRYEYIMWARQRDGYIIEDDFDSEFSQPRKPLETVWSMDESGRVIYMNTFTKTLAPSMRMGYMLLPNSLMQAYEEKLGFYSCTVPAFDQYVIAEFIERGYFERHLNRLRRRLRQNEDR